MRARPATTLVARLLSLSSLLVAMAAALVVVGPPTVAAGEGPAPGGRAAAGALVIEQHAAEGPRGTILAVVRGRCAPGLRVARFTTDFAQGDVVTPTTTERPFPCDGRWHRRHVTSLEAFEPGHARLTARARLVDARTGAYVRTVAHSRTIVVRAAAAVALPATATLQDGELLVTVRARCDTPWLAQSFSVSAHQPSVDASAYASLPLTCDRTTQQHVFRLTSVSGPFVPGSVELSAEVTLLDPEHFDPVAQATASRVARVR